MLSPQVRPHPEVGAVPAGRPGHVPGHAEAAVHEGAGAHREAVRGVPAGAAGRAGAAAAAAAVVRAAAAAAQRQLLSSPAHTNTHTTLTRRGKSAFGRKRQLIFC